MAYRDPYIPGAQRPSTEYYNPYNDTAEPHRTYDQGGYDSYNNAYNGGYKDEPFQPPPQDIQRTFVDASNNKEPDGFGAGPALAGTRTRCAKTQLYGAIQISDAENSSASAIRSWRYNHQGNLWTKVRNESTVDVICSDVIIGWTRTLHWAFLLLRNPDILLPPA